MLSRALLALVTAILSGTSLAHQDRIIEIRPNGALVGLPKEYRPAKLMIQFGNSDANLPPIKSAGLRLGAHRTDLPVCVTGLLRTQRLTEVFASASWYHDESTLPYYLSVMFPDPGHNGENWSSPGFSLLFNLRTGRLIEMQARIYRALDQSVQHVPVDLAARCTHAEMSLFKASLSP